MKLQNRLKRAAVLASALLVLAFFSPVALGEEYSFKVQNNTKQTIKKLLASEDGDKYGFFDIGKGIKAGESMTLVWDKSTAGGKCTQDFKAVYEDDSESEAETFNFCEKDLELEFD